MSCSHGGPRPGGISLPYCNNPAAYIVYRTSFQGGIWPSLRCRQHALLLLLSERVGRLAPLRSRP